MDERFPYGYDVNAYIDKAFEQMKADFPWATRDMIAEHTCYGIAKVGGDYQYVAFWNNDKGKPEPNPLKIDCEGFIKKLADGHEWELERANPVKETIDVPATNTYSCDWYLEIYRIRKHEQGGYSAYVQAGNRSAGGSRTMKIITISIFLFTSAILAACGGRSVSGSDDINPRDTVTVPEGITGEDSIAYIENAVYKDHITVSDFLELAEVHELEDRLFLYHDSIATPRDKAAMRLANRFMRMHYVALSGDANSKLQWAMAVNAVLDTFRVAVPSIPKDSVLNEIIRVADEYSSETQSEMNFQCYIRSSVDYYRTIEAYRQWIQAVPSDIRPLVQEEYEAWHDLNSTRFTLWDEVSYRQEWYSMKPMEIEGYRENLSSNRRAELEVEREIILNGKSYQQKGKTVTAKEWEQWIADCSVPEDIDDLKKMGDADRIPSDSLVADRVNTLKSTFARWLKARQALAAALPKEQGEAYDFLTADIHSRMVGKLADIIPYENW